MTVRCKRATRVCIRLVMVVGAFACAGAEAAAPKQTAAFGIALDATPEAVTTLLSAKYPACPLARTVYRVRPGDSGPQTAELAINAGLAANDPASLAVCNEGPAGDGIIDSIEARFTHPQVDARQRLYALLALRIYPDAVNTESRRVRVSFDDVRRDLFRMYGKPIDERKERTVSNAANAAASLGVYRKVKRDDYLVRYLWAEQGRLDDVERDDDGCDCSGRYVKAVIEMTRSPSTRPSNTFYALSVKLIVEDAALRRRQAAWNAQWQRKQ